MCTPYGGSGSERTSGRMRTRKCMTAGRGCERTGTRVRTCYRMSSQECACTYASEGTCRNVPSRKSTGSCYGTCRCVRGRDTGEDGNSQEMKDQFIHWTLSRLH